MTKHTDAEAEFGLRVGKFLFEFSQLECLIQTEVARVIRSQDKYLDIASLGFEKLLSVTEDVLTEEQPYREAEIRLLMEDCRRINDARVSVTRGLPASRRASDVEYGLHSEQLFRLIVDAQTLSVRVLLISGFHYHWNQNVR